LNGTVPPIKPEDHHNGFSQIEVSLLRTFICSFPYAVLFSEVFYRRFVFGIIFIKLIIAIIIMMKVMTATLAVMEMEMMTS